MSDALIPMLFLVGMLVLSLYLFGLDTTDGPAQVALIFSALVGALVALKNGHTWPNLTKAVTDGINMAMGAIFILLAIGALIGTWAISGTIPGMVYYGAKILHPNYFYVGSFLVCGAIALCIGSSWTTAGTIGIGLMGVSALLGMNQAITAGAIVSGAYVGGLSPLSDIVLLSSGIVGVPPYTHIKHVLWSVVPSIVIAAALFLIIGWGDAAGQSDVTINAGEDILHDVFNINLLVMLPLVVVIILAIRKFPPFPTILAGALIGGIMAAILQPDLVRAYAADPSLATPFELVKGVWLTMAQGYQSDTGSASLDSLVSLGGMASMLTTVWLILAAMSFGAVMEYAGFLERINQTLLKAARSTGSLVATTVLTTIGLNIIAGDQYLAVVLPGRMYQAEFRRRNLAPENLSRCLSDAGGPTSALVPWNTCGAFLSATLGIATFSYLPYAFFCLTVPVVSMVLGFTGIKIKPLEGGGENRIGALPAMAD